MAVKIAINGFGRIGRQVLRALFEGGRDDVEIVAINDLTEIATLAHLLKYDSVHGGFPHEIAIQGTKLRVGDQLIRVSAARDPKELDWSDIDVVCESTGVFTSQEKAEAILASGARKILISAPASGVSKTIVYGVNHSDLTAEDVIVSNASCTTNCLAPLAQVIDAHCGIATGYMTTVHAYTSDQPTHDRPHKDLYRARAAALSMIPTSTGAARAITLVLPHLKGKLEGSAIRVPTANVSLVDLSLMTERPTTIDDLNKAILDASNGHLKGILRFDEDPKVSIDYNHDPHSCSYAAPLTTLTEGGMLRVLAWYDNEWGFSNRMLDTASLMGRLS